MNLTVLSQLFTLFIIISLGPSSIVYFSSKKLI